VSDFVASKRNASQSAKLQLTAPAMTQRVLDEMAAAGLFGSNRAEVATYLLQNWIQQNAEFLRGNGIALSASLNGR
jgi:hypothetical protein